MFSTTGSLQLPLPGGHAISTGPTPRIASAMSSPHVLVIGGGVTGLITSWVLLDRGYRVTILAKEWANNSTATRLTSQIAGALWEFPPAVCGSHTDACSLKRSKKWAMDAYHVWRTLAAADDGKDMGVEMVRSVFYFPEKVVGSSNQLGKMLEIEGSGVLGFAHSASLIDEMGIDPQCGAVDAYELLVPAIDTDKAMHWLMSLIKAKGARFITEEITTDLLSIENSLRARFRADAIINCSGLASHVLASDPKCYPLRGGLLRFANDGKSFPKLNHALSISADATATGEIIFIVPRDNDTLIVGGFAEPDQWSLTNNINSPIVRRMHERAIAFLPALKNAKLDPVYPFAQGLRPARMGNVRLEKELRNPDSCIIHSYGHGGSGWSFSFGCAAEVVNMLGETVRKDRARDQFMARL